MLRHGVVAHGMCHGVVHRSHLWLEVGRQDAIEVGSNVVVEVGLDGVVHVLRADLARVVAKRVVRVEADAGVVAVEQGAYRGDLVLEALFLVCAGADANVALDAHDAAAVEEGVRLADDAHDVVPWALWMLMSVGCPGGRGVLVHTDGGASGMHGEVQSAALEEALDFGNLCGDGRRGSAHGDETEVGGA